MSDARSAQETLRTAVAAGVRFHIVVMNASVREGDMDSQAVSRALRGITPNVPILLVCSPRTPFPGGVASHTTPVLPLVRPLAWSQLAAGLERAVRAVQPSESLLTITARAGAACDADMAMPAHSTTAGEAAS